LACHLRKKGTTFTFKAFGNPVSAIWSDTIPGEFAKLTLNKTQEWGIENEHFIFLLELYQLGRQALLVRLPESIVRASIITLPAGQFTLFGYLIDAAKDGAIVKFLHGKATENVGCTVSEIEE
jgi:hypothetical protein